MDVSKVGISRYANLPKPLKAVFTIFTIVTLGVAVLYLFSFSFHGQCLISFGFYYLLMALLYPCVFLILPARKKDRTIPWYDFLAAALGFSLCLYFFPHAYEISLGSWRSIPLGILLIPLILEGGRRTGGPIFLVVCLVLGLYPLYAECMPGILWGSSCTVSRVVESVVFSEEGVVGLPAKVIFEIVLGFLVFAGFLIASGAGKFFLDLAQSIFGRYRGGPAKVSVVASAFFGSLSGSIFSNIIATGSVTIPTMKRIGYPPHYAGAIEACASTGGVLMPPIMGAVAFVMCELLGIEYAVIIVAAAIPSLLYYFGLLMQVDAYAARVGLKGLPREEIPSLKKTLKEGWQFIFVFIFLLWGLLYMRWERLAPWYATGLMFLLSFVRRETAMTPRRFLKTVVSVGELITQTVAIVIPIGFILCGLILTGAAPSLTAGVVTLGMGNIVLILLVGVAACYVLGMAGLMISAYIFLAVTLAPAIIQVAQLNVLAVHLFIIYYAMLSAITPPVAVGAFVAATIAGSKPMRTAFTAMRLGIVIYFIPFFFIFNPALVLEGSPLEALYLFMLCLIGIVFIAAGCEGYLVKLGKVELWARPFLLISGLLIGFPEWKTTIIGAILALFIVAVMLIKKRATEGNL